MKSLMPQIDSNDGLFHNGNPATGEQGTRVTDTWLNNLQDRVRDVQAEAHYVLQKAGFQPVENKQTQLYEAIVKIIDDNRKTASLTQKGETKLYTGYDSQSEDLALTPKTAYQLKQLIDSNTRSLGNVIPNSKKSSSINSNSSDTVATSVAVKTANDNANGRVSKSGDTMTGGLTVPNIIVNDPTNNNNFVQIGDDTKLIDVDMGHTVGLQATDNANDAYIAYGATKKKFGFDGFRFYADSSIFTAQYGHGSYAAQYTSNAPYMVEESGSATRDTYHPFIKGRVRKNGQYGTAFSFGYTTRQGSGDGFGRGIIHLIEDNGKNITWNFEHNGDFVAPGDVLTARGKSLNNATQLSDFSYLKIGNFEVRKYPDGTMIQSYFVDFNDVHGANSGLGGPGPKQLTWAVSFVGKPLVWGNITSSIEDSHDVGVNILTKSTGTTLYWYNYEHSNPNQGACRLQFLAIGRWK